MHGIAYLTNAFGNLIAAGALAALLIVTEKRWLVPLVVASACAIVAFLTHVSTFLILLGTLLVIGFVARLWKRRTLAVIAVAVAVVAGAVAWTVYYRHFTTVYKELSTRPANATVGAVVPVQRAEAHQTVWVRGWTPLRNRIFAIPGYLQKYFGWPVLVLSVAGVLHSVRRSASERDGLDVVLVAWVVTASAFLLVSLFSPLDLRYYLASAPAVAALGGCTMARWIAGEDRRWRILAYGLFALVVIQGIAYVVRFFVSIPR